MRPRHVLQQEPARSWIRTLLRRATAAAATLVIHLAFAAGLLALLTWRAPLPPRDVEIPVEMVTSAPEPPPAPKPPPEPPKPDQPPKPPGSLAPTAEAPAPQPPTPSMPLPVSPPLIVEPPPEPTRAAAQDRESKPANVAPDRDVDDQTKREAHPVAIPQTLASSDPAAAFTVPTAIAAKPPDPLETPSPAIPARVPSETEKLAAALPMDLSALPASFRAVLSGSGAQVSAAYKGLVYGRFSRTTAEIGERARRRHLKGQVVVAFTIDDTGKLSSLSVLQTSGDAAVDALGLELIRSAAPFPPPPQDAQRSFMPVFAFGG